MNYQLFVKIPNENTIIINCDVNTTTGKDLKKIISEKSNIPYDNMRLVTQSRPIYDYKFLKDSNVGNESNISIFPNLKNLAATSTATSTPTTGFCDLSL